jgi:hypothetical protein
MIALGIIIPVLPTWILDFLGSNATRGGLARRLRNSLRPR